jgi:hypothetical protein
VLPTMARSVESEQTILEAKCTSSARVWFGMAGIDESFRA